jgi:hypothetical protein
MSEETVVRKKKNVMLPVLVVLFLAAYGMMTMLIVEQGSTIESQKLLIRQLFSDSVQLSALKGKAAREKANAHAAPVKPVAPPAAQSKPAPPKRGPRLDARQAVEQDARRILVSI